VYIAAGICGAIIFIGGIALINFLNLGTNDQTQIPVIQEPDVVVPAPKIPSDNDQRKIESPAVASTRPPPVGERQKTSTALMLGIEIYNAENKRVGKVKDIVVDKQGKLNEVVISTNASFPWNYLPGRKNNNIVVPYESVEWKGSQPNTDMRFAPAPAWGVIRVTPTNSN
jgi:sporulation protein YlmC with PRC-barrel domain